MSVNFEKLKQLWKIRDSVLVKEPEIKRRAEQIYEILKTWDDAKDPISNIGDHGSAKDNNIPTDNWNAVMGRFKEFYDNHPDLKGHDKQVGEIANLLHLQYRDARFRVSSNAIPDSQFERRNTEPTQANPETHFASYNFPYEIIKFYLSCSGSQPFANLHFVWEYRFIPKFIWMLANRNNVIPIFSLQSFREFSSLFHTLAESVDWGDREDRWALSLSDFVKAWAEVSNQFCRRITDSEYSALTDEKKRSLAVLLFIASVSPTTTKNAFDMIQTGNKAIILYGPPGTGKTYYAQELANQLLTPRTDNNDTEIHADVNPDVEAFLGKCNFTKLFGNSDSAEPKPYAKLTHGCWEIVQFHPSYSYQDFIGGIMPNVKGETLSYTVREGIFKRFCEAAKVNHDYPFILIIDEINRADLSSVFGELMYAIEYRGRPVNTIQFGQFSVPQNVYIIGTMNTTDKSLVTFDLALRRRFQFMKLGPDLNTLYDWNAERKSSPPFPDSEISAFIASAESLNKALVATEGLGLPEDYAIGQAYFMKIRDFCAAEDGGTRHISEFARERLWDYHLEPLIEEYLGVEAKTWKSKIEEMRKQFTKQEQSVS